jgi:hypothetical protein
MEYTQNGANVEMLQYLGIPGHHPTAYRTRMSPEPSNRWIEITCSCGAVTKACWDETVNDCTELANLAWFLGCGFILPRDTAAFMEHHSGDDSDVVKMAATRVYGSPSQSQEGPEHQ